MCLLFVLLDLLCLWLLFVYLLRCFDCLLFGLGFVFICIVVLMFCFGCGILLVCGLLSVVVVITFIALRLDDVCRLWLVLIAYVCFVCYLGCVISW